jgi:death-on-curing protein
MRYLVLSEVLELHRLLVEQSGGSAGIRDLGALQSAVAQPRMTFGGQELYATVQEKAAAICFSLVMNHPFVDANKRVGHAAMETFLVLNGWQLDAPVDDAERVMLGLAAGGLTRNELLGWVNTHVRLLPDDEED